MRVRIDIGRLVLHEQSMSRREQAQLREDIGNELSRLLSSEHVLAPRPDRRQRRSIATQIAAAVAAQLPPRAVQHGTGARR